MKDRPAEPSCLMRAAMTKLTVGGSTQFANEWNPSFDKTSAFRGGGGGGGGVWTPPTPPTVHPGASGGDVIQATWTKDGEHADNMKFNIWNTG
jgi:hypothetical protein